MAISGQVMNDFNFEEVMREILKGNGERVREAAVQAATEARAAEKKTDKTETDKNEEVKGVSSKSDGETRELTEGAGEAEDANNEKEEESISVHFPFAGLALDRAIRESLLKTFFKHVPSEILQKGLEVTQNVEEQFSRRKLEVQKSSWFSLF